MNVSKVAKSKNTQLPKLSLECFPKHSGVKCIKNSDRTLVHMHLTK